jgi:hypothetical protein
VSYLAGSGFLIRVGAGTARHVARSFQFDSSLYVSMVSGVHQKWSSINKIVTVGSCIAMNSSCTWHDFFSWASHFRISFLFIIT